MKNERSCRQASIACCILSVAAALASPFLLTPGPMRPPASIIAGGVLLLIAAALCGVSIGLTLHADDLRRHSRSAEAPAGTAPAKEQ